MGGKVMAEAKADQNGGSADSGASMRPIFRKAQEYALEKDWKGYFGAVLGKPARETLLDALARFEKEPAAGERFAIDLGCGEGRDTLELLGRGWRVLAVDLMPEAFEHLLARVPAGQAPRLRTLVGRFEEIELPACDLLNASFALPFCEPDRFGAVWDKVAGSVRTGGRFAGQLFGDRDDWVRCGDRCHFPRPQVERMFRDFVLEHFREEEKDEADGRGGKHWHIYHIVARKR
jgi:tellurite methyltransferase